MLGKILLTFFVAAIAFVILRQRQTQSAKQPDKKTGSDMPKDPTAGSEISSDLRFAAYTFLALMIGLAAAMYYFQWQDDHTIVTVTLHRDGQSSPINYEVYKFQLGDRSFVTIDGLTVTVADSERMEISGLD